LKKVLTKCFGYGILVSTRGEHTVGTLLKIPQKLGLLQPPKT